LTTFVLVHGAWQGPSTWDRVTPLLESKKHRVLPATLSGLGPRGYELSQELTLDHHVNDIVGLFEYEDLEGAVLVGHSYAGTVITAAAERVAPRVKALVYIDAFVPKDGQATLQLLPEQIREAFKTMARTHGDGWRLPSGENLLDVWGLKEGPHRDFVRKRLCDFSIRFFESTVRLPGPRPAERLKRAYISCVAEDYPARPAFAPFARVAKQGGWPYLELESGHDCHVERPGDVAEFLMAV
jgi:pimeloyl-ACP methyl ester carboxylesterase